MITCRELIELLLEYVSEELEPERREHVEKHLQCCPPCIAYLETYRLTIRLVRQLPAEPMPPELIERLRIALGEPRQESD